MSIFIGYEDAAAKFFRGSKQALDEAVLLGGLPTLIQLAGVLARTCPAGRDPFDDARSGLLGNYPETAVRGWRRLPLMYARDVAMSDSTGIPFVCASADSYDGPFDVFVDNGSSGIFGISKVITAKRDLWFRTEDILMHLKSPSDSKPPPDDASSKELLGKRERTSLLLIIGALAQAAKIDIAQPHKAAGQIESILRTNGIAISPRTIGEHLKTVQKTMENSKG